jgi:hypothetical protein
MRQREAKAAALDDLKRGMKITLEIEYEDGRTETTTANTEAEITAWFDAVIAVEQQIETERRLNQ